MFGYAELPRPVVSDAVADFSAIRYSTDGPVATITLARPEKANAQNSALLDELDEALDLADEDDGIRVVILDADGDHFSAGHDLKELWQGELAEQRSTAEGKLRHEQEMYFDGCLRLRDFRKPTIAAVQGRCMAAGLMLAAMCDLIVAADDASFSNPVARMTGAGVELLVEPWELGARKAKEFLLAATVVDAEEAERLGLVNRVVPRDELAGATAALAEQVAKVPPITAEMVKGSINNMLDRQGQVDSWRYHFMVHQFVSNTDTALRAAETRAEGGMDAARAEQADP